MILWIMGNSGAGKTTLAKKLRGKNTIILDGDDMRASICRDLGLSAEDRRENNLRVARLAAALESQGFSVIVSMICPTDAMRAEVKAITGCSFIYLPYLGDDKDKMRPFERPQNADIVLPERILNPKSGKTLLREGTAYLGG